MSSEERKQYEDQELKGDDRLNTKDFFIGAFIGGVIGAGAALLLAPKSGKDLVNDINEQTTVFREKTDHLRETAIQKGTEFATIAKEKTNSLSQTMSKQSNELVNKMKRLKVNDDQDEAAVSSIVLETNELNDQDERSEEIQLKLEETKKAFDETEGKIASIK